MPLQRFLIAPETEGQVNNLLPWLISDRAFEEQYNCYTWHGRIKKRFGSLWMQRTLDQKLTRLRLSVGVISGAGTLAGNVGGTKWKIGQQFSVGNDLLTVWQANGAMLTTGAVTGTYDTATGAFTIAGAVPATIVYFYPLEPGMGAYNYEQTVANLSPTIVFDTQYAYQYDLTTGGFLRLTGGNDTWSGNDDNFFWAITWRNTNTFNINDNINIFFATNNVNPIRYWNGTTWTNFQPLLAQNPVGPVNTNLVGAKIVVAYKGHFIALNTLEQTGVNTPQRFGNRARISWTQSLLGQVVNPQGVMVNAIDNAFFEASGRGSYLDAPTSEAIVSAAFIKDRLIVEFEESTFQLVYTGAPDLPFVWQRIDNNFGATSTLGQVSFNQYVIGFGKNAIVSCNGAQVSRIDQNIPQAVFQIAGRNDTFQRVSGIRDYFEENIYWTFPDSSNGSVYPSKVLVYDYVNGNWSFNDDSFTVFGNHYQQFGLTWATWTTPWNQSTWQWQDGENVRAFKSVIAANQQGWVVQLENDLPTNAPALSINNITGTTLAIRDHNLSVGDFIKITGCTGSTNLNDQIVEVLQIPTLHSVVIGIAGNAGYTGGGVAARVSRVNLKTKQYNFFTQTGQQSFIPYVEFLVNNLGSGQDNLPAPVVPPYDPTYDPDLNRPRIRVNYFVSTSGLPMIQQAVNSGAAFGVNGGNVIDMFPYAEQLPIEVTQQRFWKRVYFQAQGETVQFQIYYDDDMMVNPNQSLVGFELHAMLIYASPRGVRFNG